MKCKKFIEGFSHKFELTQEYNSTVDGSSRILLTSLKTEKMIKRNTQSFRGLSNNIKLTNIFVMGEEKRIEKHLKK